VIEKINNPENKRDKNMTGNLNFRFISEISLDKKTFLILVQRFCSAGFNVLSRNMHKKTAVSETGEDQQIRDIEKQIQKVWQRELLSPFPPGQACHHPPESPCLHVTN